MGIKHAFTSAVSDGGDSSLVRPSNWNADHVLISPIPVSDGTNQFFELRSTNKFNTYIGFEAGYTCTIGYGTSGGSDGTANTAVGYQALKAQTNTGKYNTGLGTHAGTAITDGYSNVLLGPNTGLLLTTGWGNVCVGHNAIGNGGTAQNTNVAIGYQAMYNATPSSTVAIGAYTLKDATGSYNCAVGYNAGTAVSSGQFNLLFGLAAGASITTGSENIVFGVYGNTTAAGASNEFVAGSEYTRIDNVYFGNGPLWTSPAAVTINGTGGSGTNVAGGDLKIAGGKGTGTGTPGRVILQAPAVGTTGTTLQSLVDVVTVYGTKTVGLAALTVATLPAAGTPGRFAYVSDGSGTPAWGDTVAGSGSSKYLVFDNGTNWTVAGK